MKKMKSLLQLLKENCIYYKGYSGKADNIIYSGDLRGQYDRSRLFWTYRNDPKAVALFGKVFGGFSLILKTARGLHGYVITGKSGDLKFQFMEPHEVYKQVHLMEIIQKGPRLREYIDVYIKSRGVCLFNVRVVQVKKELDKHITEGGIINMKGKDLAAKVLATKKQGTWYAYQSVRPVTIMRANNGNLHISAYNNSDWRPAGWCVKGEYLTTAHDLKGKNLNSVFNMSNTLVMHEDEYLTQQMRNTISPTNNGCFRIILYPDTEYIQEFKKAWKEAKAWYTINKIKQLEKTG